MTATQTHPTGPATGQRPADAGVAQRLAEALRPFVGGDLPVRLVIPERIGKPALKVLDHAWELRDEQVVWVAGEAFGVASIGEVPEGALEHHRRRLALG